MNSTILSLALTFLGTGACQGFPKKSVSQSSPSASINSGSRPGMTCRRPPSVQVGDKAFLMYRQIRNTLRTPTFTNPQVSEAARQKELARVIRERLRAIGGMPRAQLAGILKFALERDHYHLTEQNCRAKPSQLMAAEGINQFFDGILDTFEGRSSEDLAKDLVASSLSDCPLDETQKGFMATTIPDSDIAPWTEVSRKEPTLDRMDFPSAAGETITFANGLKPVLQWESKHTKELTSWKQEFDQILDCEQRAQSKKVPAYKTWAECIQGLQSDEVQLLAGKLVFDWAYTMLVDESKELKTSENFFRGVVDVSGKLQGFTVVENRLNINEFRRHHNVAISSQARQIPAIYVSFLVTAPWNLKNNSKSRVKGVGSSLIALSVLESQRRKPWNGRLILESMPSAASFYKKMGFWSIGTRSTIATDFYPLQLFWLEGEEGQKILSRSGLKIQTSP